MSLSDLESALQPFLDFMAHIETYKDYIVGFQWVYVRNKIEGIDLVANIANIQGRVPAPSD